MHLTVNPIQGGRRVALAKNRRLGQPQGNFTVIDITHTSELRLGDVIYITGLGIAASVTFKGSSEYFTVFGFDQGANKVGVKDEDGDEHWFGGGTKAELLAALQDKAGYKTVTIYRPASGSSASSAQGAPVQGDSWKRVFELIEEAKNLGLPGGYGPFLPAGNSPVLNSGDFILLVDAQGTPIPRLYRVIGQHGPDGMTLALAGSPMVDDQDLIGTQYRFPFISIDNRMSMAFKPGLPIPDRDNPTGTITTASKDTPSMLVIGGVVLAAILIGIEIFGD